MCAAGLLHVGREATREREVGVAARTANSQLKSFSFSSSVLYTENFSGYAPLVRLHLAERLQVNFKLLWRTEVLVVATDANAPRRRLHELCRTLQNFALSRSAKISCSIFAASIDR